jgi:hypothetical protein
MLVEMSLRLLTVGAGVVLGAMALSSARVCACRSAAAGAIGALRAINSAQQAYAAACGAGGFAVDLADLAAAPADGGLGFVSPDLSRNGVIKDGYAVTLMADSNPQRRGGGVRAATCRGAKHPPATAYFATAMPVGEPAARPFFATDARGTIYQSPKPIANPITAGPDVVVLR